MDHWMGAGTWIVLSRRSSGCFHSIPQHPSPASHPPVVQPSGFALHGMAGGRMVGIFMHARVLVDPSLLCRHFCAMQPLCSTLGCSPFTSFSIHLEHDDGDDYNHDAAFTTPHGPTSSLSLLFRAFTVSGLLSSSQTSIFPCSLPTLAFPFPRFPPMPPLHSFPPWDPSP